MVLIETDHLVIRPFTLDDTAVIYALSQEPGMKRFIPDQVYADEAEAAGVLRSLIARYADPDAARAGLFVLAVELAATGEVIGHVGLSPYDGAQEIGYAIAEAHQRRGFATEAVGAMVRWALHDGGLPRVRGIVDGDNTASIRVLDKAGFARVTERDARRRHVYEVTAP